MKTKGFWVIKYSNGQYFCGPNFDKQLRKAQIYVWLEMAQEQAEHLKKVKSAPTEEFDIVSVEPPKETKDTIATWEFTCCSNCGKEAPYDTEHELWLSNYCPHCGRRMINGTEVF